MSPFTVNYLHNNLHLQTWLDTHPFSWVCYCTVEWPAPLLCGIVCVCLFFLAFFAKAELWPCMNQTLELHRCSDGCKKALLCFTKWLCVFIFTVHLKLIEIKDERKHHHWMDTWLKTSCRSDETTETRLRGLKPTTYIPQAEAMVQQSGLYIYTHACCSVCTVYKAWMLIFYWFCVLKTE